MTFQTPQPFLRIDVTLAYIAIVLNSRGDYLYAPPMSGFIDNDEGEYNAITWYDADPKPTWLTIQANWMDAWTWAGITATEEERIANLESYQYDLDGQLASVNSTIDDLLGGSVFALASHDHDSRYYTKTQVDDFLTPMASKSYVDSHIASVIGAAPAALDTLKEIADQLAADESAVGALTTSVANKVDKVSGKGLSANDFTSTLKTKLDTLGGGAAQANVTGTAPTNAPADAVTSYGLLAPLLGADANATNTKQNATATNVNAIAVIVNALETSHNALLAKLRTQGILLT